MGFSSTFSHHGIRYHLCRYNNPGGIIKNLSLFGLLCSLIVVFNLSGCDRSADISFNKTIYSFGTLVEVELYADNASQADDAFDLIQQDLDFMHKNWHAWEPGALGRVNQLLPTGEWFAISPSMVKLISRAQEISLLTDNLFNPAIGQLIAAWGFHRDEPAFDPASHSTIRSLVEAAPSMEDIEFDGIRIRSTNPVVQLDLGAFAKGYGLGVIADHLQTAGFNDFVLNAGGDLVVSGQHRQGNRPWRIGIRNPEKQTVLATVEVAPGEGVFTSGDYERFYTQDDKKRHHIIHPVTGLPATGTRAVTVVSSDPGLADAAATALLVAGKDGWIDIANRLGISAIMLIDDSNTIYMTESMAKRVQFSEDQKFELLTQVKYSG